MTGQVWSVDQVNPSITSPAEIWPLLAESIESLRGCFIGAARPAATELTPGQLWVNNAYATGKWAVYRVVTAAGIDALEYVINTTTGAVERPGLPVVVGSAANVSMTVTAASATATLTADEVVVHTALGGTPFKIAGVNKTINLATTGAGGMDTGLAPVSGYVAIYLIYNPTTEVSALLARDTTSIVAGEVYGGANMPAGYTESALISVWPTDASRLLKIGRQKGRSIKITGVLVLNTSVQHASLTSLSISSAVPINATVAYWSGSIGATTASNNNMSVASTSGGVGISTLRNDNASTAMTTAGNASVLLSESQTIYYTNTSSAGTNGAAITISGYDF